MSLGERAGWGNVIRLVFRVGKCHQESVQGGEMPSGECAGGEMSSGECAGWGTVIS